MPNQHTDQYWESLGRTNPYWGVVTHERYDKDKLTPEVLQEFYASGEGHVVFLLQTIRKHLDEHFTPETALDFGCGVGRITIPLGRVCRSVLGLDVSQAILQKARDRCESLGVGNVRFEKNDDALAGVRETFDLINSYIVLQHIPCDRGEAIVRRLLDRLNDGGVGALHITYYNEPRSQRPRLRALAERWGIYPVVRAARGAGQWLVNRVFGAHPESREMQMNAYRLNSVLLYLQQAGVRRFYVDFTNHGGCYGVYVFFQKRLKDQYLW